VERGASLPATPGYHSVVALLALVAALLVFVPATAPLAPPGSRAGAAPAKSPPAAARAPIRPPAPAGLSWDDSDALSTTVARVERRLRSGRPPAKGTLVVTERQLNSYVNLELGPRIPAGVTDLRLSLVPDGLGARAMVDLDRVKSKTPGGAAGLISLLSGTVPVQLRGRLAAVNGKGLIQVEEATVGGISLPPALVAQLVALSTRSAARPQGFDIQAPFPLPWGARQVRLETGRALIDFLP
jgi:hypothetical protein